MSSVRRWLWLLWASVLVMVMLGGVTRLTGSGLSIVEWRPLFGVLPPLNDADWRELFERYRASPQYRLVNAWMGIEDFKRIFFWEYVHRLVGRLVGVVFVAPWLWFVARRELSGPLARRTLFALALGGAQGLLGWLMVKSGLGNEPTVSPLLLAAHLVLAFGVGQWLLWMALDLVPVSASAPAGHGVRVATWALVGLVAIQSAYGALMAGTRAGLLYATFPDMDGRYLPGSFFLGDIGNELLHGPSAIHWMHRALGWLVLVYTLGLAVFLRQSLGRGAASRLGIALACVTLVQLNLGAFVVVYRVPVGLAVVHQATAYLVLSVAVALCHRLGSAAHAVD